MREKVVDGLTIHHQKKEAGGFAKKLRTLYLVGVGCGRHEQEPTSHPLVAAYYLAAQRVLIPATVEFLVLFRMTVSIGCLSTSRILLAFNPLTDISPVADTVTPLAIMAIAIQPKMISIITDAFPAFELGEDAIVHFPHLKF